MNYFITPEMTYNDRQTSVRSFTVYKLLLQPVTHVLRSHAEVYSVCA